MAEFIRARSEEQKAERMAEIKSVTEQLFKEYPYHEITLSTIGEKLGWSRANLYKYVCSKEEIFLQLTSDAMIAYFEALEKAFTKAKNLTIEDAAKKWANVSAKHRDWAIYGSILVSIFETNVTVERLIEFKRGYYTGLNSLRETVAPAIGTSEEDFDRVFYAIHYHEMGLSGFCMLNPIALEAMKALGVKTTGPNIKKEMETFIAMCLKEYSTLK